MKENPLREKDKQVLPILKLGKGITFLIFCGLSI